MCLIVFDWRPAAGPGPLFTLTANRDEYFRRTADPLAWWADAPDLLAGRDLTAGGTWLGVSRDGRFAALTNHRAPNDMRPDAPTRGTLVSAYLQGAPLAPLAYLHRVAANGAAYNGFNLLAGDFTLFPQVERVQTERLAALDRQIEEMKRRARDQPPEAGLTADKHDRDK